MSMSRMRHAAAIAPLLILGTASSSSAPIRWNAGAAPPPVAFNDNRVSAGVVRAGVLDVHLEVDTGEWHPYSKDSAGVRILAFREAGHPLETPGPMLRVVAGERIHAWVTNRAAAQSWTRSSCRPAQPATWNSPPTPRGRTTTGARRRVLILRSGCTRTPSSTAHSLWIPRTRAGEHPIVSLSSS